MFSLKYLKLNDKLQLKLMDIEFLNSIFKKLNSNFKIIFKAEI